MSLFGSPMVYGQHTSMYKNEISFGLQNTQFISEAYAQTDHKTFQSFTAGYNNTDIEKRFFYADLHAQMYWKDSSLSTLNVKDLFFSFQVKKVNYRIGRSTYKWSELDKNFNLGVIQPVDRTTSLDLNQQGLTGLFIEMQNTPTLRSALFVSPLFIPDQGAPFEIEAGSFKPVNPWFTSPPTNVLVNGNLTRVNYDFNTPEIGHVVQQKSIGLNLQYLESSFNGLDYGNGFSFNASFLYKPTEQLQLIYDGYLSPDLTIETQITPVVNQHTVFAADAGYSFEWFNLVFSGIYEKQDFISVNEQETISLYEPQIIVSIAAQFPTYELKNRLALVHVNGGEKKVTGPLANYIQDWLPNRMPFKNAAKWELNYEWKGHFNLGFEYLASLSDSFSTVKMNSSYFMTDNLKLSGKLLLIAAEVNAKQESSDFYNYQDNDQVQMGITYVF